MLMIFERQLALDETEWWDLYDGISNFIRSFPVHHVIPPPCYGSVKSPSQNDGISILDFQASETRDQIILYYK